MALKKEILGIVIIMILVTATSITIIETVAVFSPPLIVLDYLCIMRNLNSSVTRNALRSMFDRNYNFTELYQWEHKHVKFINTGESFERSSDPLRILQVQKGRCGEFSILYVALCLAHGYEARLALAVDVSCQVFWIQEHNFAEVKIGNNWTHVDPSDQVWNQTSHYAEWPWGKTLGSASRIYAFEEGKATEVTQTYRI